SAESDNIKIIMFTDQSFSELDSESRALNSFPTRRSSDLSPLPARIASRPSAPLVAKLISTSQPAGKERATCLRAINESSQIRRGDRKSTRLNSSHVKISYAVFCLKKKNLNSNNSVYLHDR